MNLNILILLPLLTAIVAVFAKTNNQVKWISLIGSVAQLVACIALLIAFYAERNAGNMAQMLFEQRVTWFGPLNIEYYIGVDGISISMILLTVLVVLAGVLVSWNIEKLTKEFFLLLIFLSAGAYGFFISLDIFTMFFFLEMAVIPKFLLIGIWGSGKKEYSAMKLALMLMAGSGLLFVAILGLYYNSNIGGGMHSFDMLKLSQFQLSNQAQMLFFPFAFVGFGIFTALFPFHTWVPDGHSSAPTAASMFLAGISMKLGGYGCLRVATYLMPYAATQYSTIIIVLATIAIIYGAFATMMQTDLKYINAYSSVSHCGFVILGIGMLTKTSIDGAVMQMVSHGLMTALFFAVIGMVYDRTHTRMLSKMGGLLKMTPFIGTVFFLAGLCSLGLPGLSGFVAEMTVFMGSWQNPEAFYRIATILGCASIVVTAVYILRAVGKVMMGPVINDEHETILDARWNEKFAAIILVAGILVIGLAPFYLMDLIAPGTKTIMEGFDKLLTLN